jgi:ribose-phosphate pyrophosphokinase
MDDPIKVFSGGANRELAQAICDHLGIALGEAEITRFSNDNIFVQIRENVRERDVFIIQSLSPPVSDNLIELLLLLDAARSASARRITAVIPYYSYARSDKKDQPRISIAARLIAELLHTAGANRILTMTLHSEQVQGFFSIPTDHLNAVPILCRHLRRLGDLGDFVALAADAGSAKRAGPYAQILGIPLAFCDKRRLDDERVVITAIVGEVRGKNIIIFDDEIARGSSLLESVKAVRERDAKNIYAACTHGVFTGDAIARIASSPLKEVVITDTVYLPPEKRIPQVTVLSVAPLFGEAIRRIHTGESVSELFE